MKRLLLFFMVGPVMMLLLPVPGLWAAQKDHENISAYSGTKSCTVCHASAAREVAGSLHYLQLGEPKYLTNWPKGKLAGMMETY